MVRVWVSVQSYGWVGTSADEESGSEAEFMDREDMKRETTALVDAKTKKKTADDDDDEGASKKRKRR